MPKQRDPNGQLKGGPEWTRLQNDLKRLGPGIRAAFNDEMRVVVQKVARDAQRRAPVRSGKLRRGITASVTEDNATVVSKAPHARTLEFGGRHPVYARSSLPRSRWTWVKQKPRPHIRPAVEAAVPEVDAAAQEAVKRAALAAGWR